MNNNPDNLSAILMLIGFFTVLYWIMRFFQTDFGGNFLIFIIFVPLFIVLIYNFFSEKETPLLDRWPYLIAAAFPAAIIYIFFIM
jgi:hypothetical protein